MALSQRVVNDLNTTTNENFKTLVDNLIEELKAAIYSSKFSRENNDRFHVAIAALDTLRGFKVQAISALELEELKETSLKNNSIRHSVSLSDLLNPPPKSELYKSVSNGRTVMVVAGSGDRYIYENKLIKIDEKALTNDELIDKLIALRGSISATASLNDRVRFAAQITFGVIVLCVAANDDQYSGYVGYQRLYPPIAEFAKLAGIEWFQDPEIVKIKKVGDKVLLGDVMINTGLLREDVFTRQESLKKLILRYEQRAITEEASEAVVAVENERRLGFDKR